MYAVKRNNNQSLRWTPKTSADDYIVNIWCLVLFYCLMNPGTGSVVSVCIWTTDRQKASVCVGGPPRQKWRAEPCPAPPPASWTSVSGLEWRASTRSSAYICKGSHVTKNISSICTDKEHFYAYFLFLSVHFLHFKNTFFSLFYHSIIPWT